MKINIFIIFIDKYVSVWLLHSVVVYFVMLLPASLYLEQEEGGWDLQIHATKNTSVYHERLKSKSVGLK